MEVILLEDVKSLGKKGQIVKINDGYARNFVLPKKLGLEATPKNLNDLKLQKAREAKEAGKTFGTISTKEVAAAAKEQLGLDIDKKKMRLDEPIKTLGNHIITVKLHKDVTAKLTVSVGESK